MVPLKLIKYPNENLRKIATTVSAAELGGAQLKQIIEQMYDVMVKHDGIGIAAPQVGVNMRLFILNDLQQDTDKRVVAINPKVISKKGYSLDTEACLSMPLISAKVKRSESIIVEALNENGKKFRLEAHGYLSRCIQHEIDHLNGIMFIDHLSLLKRNIVEKKYKKMLHQIHKSNSTHNTNNKTA